MSNSKSAINEIKKLMVQFGFLTSEPTLQSFKLEDNGKYKLYVNEIKKNKKILEFSKNDLFKRFSKKKKFKSYLSYLLTDTYNVKKPSNEEINN